MVKLFTGFSIIGVINTIIHFFVVVSLVELADFHPVPSNVAGFILANTFSYWANSRWNFKTYISSQRYAKFLTVSVLGLIITIFMSSLAELLDLHYLYGVLFIFIAMPILTFIMHYKWTWGQDRRDFGQ